MLTTKIYHLKSSLDHILCPFSDNHGALLGGHIQTPRTRNNYGTEFCGKKLYLLKTFLQWLTITDWIKRLYVHPLHSQ